ncbi:Lectin-domain containing receptor kinase A4.3 [Hordeum vulgare]|nr:Lectin-domain containing receptor kinase A4.3 [Hordeum vulgare]
MDDDLDLDAATGLASLALSGKGKPPAPRKAAAPKPEKVLTPEQRAKELAKRKDRRHAADAGDEAIAAATREALCMLGLNPSQHGLVNAAVATAVSTGSSVFPRMVLSNLPDASSCNPVPGFHVYPQASLLSGECSLEVSVVAPSTPAPPPIDLNTTPVAAGGLQLEEEDECDIKAEPLFEDELANQADGKKPKRKSKRTMTYTAAEDKLLCECWKDIGEDPKTVSARGWVSILKRWRVIQQECNKFCATLESVKARPVSGIGVQDMGHQRRGEVLGAICRPQVAWSEASREEVGDGEKARPRGKTNSKKEDKQDAASIALIATVKGMITKKDSREEKLRQEREKQMNAFLDIQRRRLDMKAEKQAQMEAEKQAKMLEIEAANAKTKAKEVALASMMTGVEIVKVDLNTVSLRKRPWFEKMQADMLKFDEE